MTNELYLKRDDVLNLFEEYQPRLATHVSEFGDALEDLKFRTLESQQGWIPVSERLPKDGQKVLVTTRSGNIIDVDTCIFYHASPFWKNYVIAWMPLQEPYQKVRKRNDKFNRISK